MPARGNSVISTLLVILVIAALGVFLGCGSSEEKAETQATAEETGAEATTAAEETAVDLASFDNPKEGICPVCKMKVEAGYVEVANITEKKYACCSAGCVAALTEDPDKYLMAEADAHEGHDH